MDILSTLLGSLTSDDSLNALTGKTGVSTAQLSGLMQQAVPMLMGALQNNASSEAGASSLLGALSQHTSQKPVAQQLQEADAEDGGKIIGHILGSNSQSSIAQLASASKLDTNQVTSVLSNLAPALMSSMSSLTSSAGNTPGLDLASLTGLLGGFDVSSLLGAVTGLGSASAGTAAAAGAKAEEKAEAGAGSILDSVLGLFKK